VDGEPAGVQIETGKADNRHLISPEDRWRVAIARQ
jgi:hypothetical protein